MGRLHGHFGRDHLAAKIVSMHGDSAATLPAGRIACRRFDSAVVRGMSVMPEQRD
jgi:hypothetical protein